ncbi:MAG: hypothetical protein KBH07_12985 [Flavobacteriales bacterium]|nr:hypothetical protein [Flavobacteriales bacterium]
MLDRSLVLFDRHKYGIIGTLMVHTLVLMVLNLSLVRATNYPAKAEPIELVLEAELPPVAQAEEQQPLAQDPSTPQPVTNLASNSTATTSPLLSRGAQQRMAEHVERDLLDMEKAEFDRLAAQRKAEGKEITVPTLDPSKFDKSNYMQKQAPKPVKVEGLTTVAYDLVGRSHLVLDVPAYLCKGSGRIVVQVAVDRSGVVTKAELDPAASSATTGCIAEHALASATQARFTNLASAPQPQRGTITYVFLAQ